MRVIILGCGRLGSQLARSLERKGHDVAVIDYSSDSFNRLGPDFAGQRLQGDGLDMDVLAAAGMREADAFVACTSGDNRNLTASQYARDLFGVSRVISRVSDPLRGQIYKELGLETVSLTVLGADLLYDALMGRPLVNVDCD